MKASSIILAVVGIAAVAGIAVAASQMVAGGGAAYSVSEQGGSWRFTVYAGNAASRTPSVVSGAYASEADAVAAAKQYFKDLNISSYSKISA